MNCILRLRKRVSWSFFGVIKSYFFFYNIISSLVPSGMLYSVSIDPTEELCNSTYSPHHHPHKTAMRSPHNYTLYNGTPNIMALIWPYNSPSLHGANPSPGRRLGLKAPMSRVQYENIRTAHLRLTRYRTVKGENGSKFSLTRGGYRQVGRHLSPTTLPGSPPPHCTD